MPDGSASLPHAEDELPATDITESYLKQHGAAWDDPETLDLDDED